MMSVPTIARPHAMPAPIAWFTTCPACPSTNPSDSSFPEESLKLSFTALVAKTPVNRAPSVPPMPCTPKASSESSYPNFCFTAATIQKHTIPARNPISSAGNGFTKPEAGVIATSPATQPEMPPSTLGLPLCSHSAITHPSAAAAAPKCVATNALLAKPEAASALPALNPNQPTHNRHAPMKLITRLCGFIESLGKPNRLPRYSAQINAETPDVMCTTVPPAKSKVGTFPPSAA